MPDSNAWRWIEQESIQSQQLNDPKRLDSLEQFRQKLEEVFSEEPSIAMTFGQPVRCAEDLTDVGLSDYLGWKLKARHAGLYRWDGSRFPCVAGFGRRPRWLTRHALLPQWLLEHGPLVRSKLTLTGLTAEESETLLGELNLLDAHLAAPIVVNDGLWGFLAMGDTVGGCYDDAAEPHLGLYGYSILNAWQRRSMGLPTRTEMLYREGRKAMERSIELWLALRPAGFRLRLLILDELPHLPRWLEMFLEGYGFEVQGTTSEKEAISILGEWRPHAALVDFSPHWRVPERFLKVAQRARPAPVLVGNSTSRNEEADALVQSLGVGQIFRRPCFFPRLAKGLFDAAVEVALRQQTLSPNERPSCLLVTRETETAWAMQGHLESRGFRVWAVSSQQDMSRLALEIKPDLVLMDLLPGEHLAIEQVSRIRSVSPSSKVVLLTSHLPESPWRAFGNSGPDVCLLKPVSLRELDRALGRLPAEVTLG